MIELVFTATESQILLQLSWNCDNSELRRGLEELETTISQFTA